MRVSEWIAIVYFLCVILLLFFSSLAWRRRILVLLSSSALIALLLLLPYGERLSSPQFLPVARDCFPLLMILSAYYQAGLLISARRDHAWEQRLLAWDKTLLEKSWLHRLRASARWLEQFGEGAYLLCYLVVPLAIPILYLARQQDLVDQFWSAVLPAVLLCYGVSPFFPSLPPRSSAPGLHLPGKSLFLRRVNLWVLKYGSIQSTIFPSAHVKDRRRDGDRPGVVARPAAGGSVVFGDRNRDCPGLGIRPLSLRGGQHPGRAGRRGRLCAVRLAFPALKPCGLERFLANHRARKTAEEKSGRKVIVPSRLPQLPPHNCAKM